MKPVMIVAGEVSGDIHAGNMLTHLRNLDPDIHPFGVGGDMLAAAGLDRVATSEELAHMGLIEVLRELPRIRGIMNRLVDEAQRRRPRVAVLVDSPDFNLRLAARLRPLGISVVLYVSPQLWAWRQGRVKTVKRLANEVLCILPFEVDFYRENGVAARYVGHPLVDDLDGENIGETASPERARRLAMLPGSRAMEIRSLLPVMIEGLRRLDPQEIADAVLIEAPGVADTVTAVIDEHGADRRLRRITGADRRSDHEASAVAWTASGTATLECALLDVPMIVGYRLHALSALLAKYLVRVPHVALANLIAGERAAPELLQEQWNPDQLVTTTRELLASGGSRQREALAKVRERLGAPGASLRAARAIAEYLE
jgi:lipid-A-disaccharide synthase